MASAAFPEVPLPERRLLQRLPERRRELGPVDGAVAVHLVAGLVRGWSGGRGGGVMLGGGVGWVMLGWSMVGLSGEAVTSHAEKMASTSRGASGMFQFASAVRISSLSMRPLRSWG